MTLTIDRDRGGAAVLDRPAYEHHEPDFGVPFDDAAAEFAIAWPETIYLCRVKDSEPHRYLYGLHELEGRQYLCLIGGFKPEIFKDYIRDICQSVTDFELVEVDYETRGKVASAEPPLMVGETPVSITGFLVFDDNPLDKVYVDNGEFGV